MDELPNLSVKDVKKSFGGVHAVTGCTFTAAAGKITSLIGPNGAGKTTVMDIISGFQRADAGSIMIGSQEMRRLRPFQISRLGVTRTFQNPREWPQLTVTENVMAAFRNGRRESLGGAIFARRSNSRLERINMAVAAQKLHEFELLDVSAEYAGNLSGGQRRLLELCKIAVAGSKVLILDEPLAGVNPVLWPVIGRSIKSFAESGSTVLLVEHNLGFVEEFSDTVTVMAEGRVVLVGSMGDVRSSKIVVDAYLGGGST